MYIIGKRQKGATQMLPAVVPLVLSASPFQHTTHAAAEIEATRLARLETTKEFVIFKAVSIVSREEPPVVELPIIVKEYDDVHQAA